MRREFRPVAREYRVGMTANTTGVEIIGKRRVRRVSIFIHNRNIKFSVGSRFHHREGFKYSPSAPQFHLSTTGDSHSLRILVLIIRSESSASLSSSLLPLSAFRLIVENKKRGKKERADRSASRERGTGTKRKREERKRTRRIENLERPGTAWNFEAGTVHGIFRH